MDNDLLLPHAVVANNCKLPEYWPDAPALDLVFKRLTTDLKRLTSGPYLFYDLSRRLKCWLYLINSHETDYWHQEAD